MKILTLVRRHGVFYPGNDATVDALAQLPDEGTMRVLVLPKEARKNLEALHRAMLAAAERDANEEAAP